MAPRTTTTMDNETFLKKLRSLALMRTPMIDEAEQREVTDDEVKALEIAKCILKLTSFTATEKIQMAELFSIAIGKKIPMPRAVPGANGTTFPYGVGAIIVPLSKPNGHNYPLGKPTMIYYASGANGAGILANGSMGNNLPSPSQYGEGCMRPATMEEIEYFFRVFSINLDAGFTNTDGMNYLKAEINKLK